MRVLLINPAYPLSENPSPPLGLAYLGAALESAGIEVRLLDYVVYPYSPTRLANVLNAFSPRLVGITAVSMNVDQALGILQDVKRIAPQTATVIGGPHVSFDCENTMMRASAVDYVVIGEGDDTLVELADALTSGKPPEDIAGLAFRRGSKIVRSAPRPFIENINTLPAPARHLIPMGRYRALGLALSMITSRGCPFKCIFCVGRKMAGPKVRYRDPRAVVDELAALGSLGFRQINIADDLFTASRAHCQAVCTAIEQRGLKMRWTAFARVDTVSADLLARMKKAGCSGLSFGVESGNAKMLQRTRKGITLSQVRHAVRLTLDSGMTPQVSFILGLPGETPDSLKETVAFAEELKHLGAMHGFHLLAPFPGTDVRENRDAYDLEILSRHWADYHANQAIVRTAAVGAPMLNAIVDAWQERFELWLDQLKQRRDRLGVDEPDTWPLTHLEHVVLMHRWMMTETIERRGRFTNGRRNALGTLGRLARRIRADAAYNSEQTDRTLAYAVERGFLSAVSQNDHVVWKWMDWI